MGRADHSDQISILLGDNDSKTCEYEAIEIELHDAQAALFKIGQHYKRCSDDVIVNAKAEGPGLLDAIRGIHGKRKA